MKLRYLLLPILLTGLLTACTPDPFTRPPLPKLNNPAPAALRQNIARSLPDRFTSDDTVIIQAPFRNDLAIIGVLRVNRPEKTFELIGLNQLGVKFFDLHGDSKGNTIRYAIPPLMKHQDLLMAVAEDIHRMFFDLLPATDAKTDINSTSVEYHEKTADGKLVYEIGGDPPILLEKRLVGFFGTIWRVTYFQYASSAGSLYPRGIVMDNERYHYRIIVKNRDWGVE